ncbi:MAG: hypothetical protein U1E65_09675 [Myxococcota bacterium]
MSLLFLIGCRDVVRQSVPAEVQAIALVEVDDAGRITGATAIQPWKMGDPITVFSGAHRTWILGFGAATASVSAETLRAGVLRAPVGCEAEIPGQLWRARIAADGSFEIPAEPAPKVTADWVGSVCPEGAAAALAWDARCSSFCPPAARPGATPCRVIAEDALCGGTFEAVIAPDGSVCVEAPAGCAATDPRAPAKESLSCSAGGCQLDVYLPPRQAPFEQSDRELFPGATPFVPTTLSRYPVPEDEQLIDGYSTDLALVAGRPRVIATAGEPILPHLGCPMQDLTRLITLDPDTVEISATSTLPSCAARIQGDAEGYFLSFTEGGRHRIGRFDPSGRRLAEADVRSATITPTYVPILERVGSKLIASTAHLDDPSESSDLWVYDASSLARLTHYPAGAGIQILYAAPIDEDRVALNRMRVANFSVFSLRTGVAEREISAITDRGRETFQPIVVPASGQIVLPERGEVYLVDPMSNDPLHVRGGAPLEQYVTGVVWPKDPRLVLLGGMRPTDSREFEAIVAFFDTRQGRLLPPAYVVGPGLVGKMLVDEGGRIWLHLPWTGRVTRLTPR